MVYVLIALALLGLLTALLMNQSNDDGGGDTSPEQAELATTKAMSYASAVQNATDQMLMSGTIVTNLSYLRPSDAGFDTAPNINKIYHPQGGGLNYEEADTRIFNTCTGPAQGWYLGAANNFEWTPTSTNDVVLSAYCVKQAVCENINKKIKNDKSVPTVAGTLADYFVPGPDWTTHANFTAALCADCDGYPIFCVKDSGTIYTAYFIIKGQ